MRELEFSCEREWPWLIPKISYVDFDLRIARNFPRLLVYLRSIGSWLSFLFVARRF